MNQSSKKQIAIAWANPYNENLGVAALAYSALALIADVVESKKLDAEIAFIGSSRNTKDACVIGAKSYSFDNFYGFDFLALKGIAALLLKPSKFKTKKLISQDIIFDLGEGDSFTDIYNQGRFNRILHTKCFFDILKKKQILLPQTIGPFNKKGNEEKAFKVMKNLKKVISRDKQSYEYTKKHLQPDLVEEAIDVAFYLPFEQVKRSPSDKKIKVGLNVSGLLWHGGYTQNNQFGLTVEYNKFLLQIIAWVSEQTNIEIHLVSHVLPTDPHMAVEDDFEAAEQVKRKFPNAIVAPRFKNPIEAKSYISGMDFFAGARMHSCIAAFSSGVPVFPMAYSRKFNGLFTETLNYPVLGDMVNHKSEQLFDNFKEAFQNREKYKAIIDNCNNTTVKERIDSLKQSISDLLNDE